MNAKSNLTIALALLGGISNAWRPAPINGETPYLASGRARLAFGFDDENSSLRSAARRRHGRSRRGAVGERVRRIGVLLPFSKSEPVMRLVCLR
jgi:hypothetical protein